MSFIKKVDMVGPFVCQGRIKEGNNPEKGRYRVSCPLRGEKRTSRASLTMTCTCQSYWLLFKYISVEMNRNIIPGDMVSSTLHIYCQEREKATR